MRITTEEMTKTWNWVIQNGEVIDPNILVQRAGHRASKTNVGIARKFLMKMTDNKVTPQACLRMTTGGVEVFTKLANRDPRSKQAVSQSECLRFWEELASGHGLSVRMMIGRMGLPNYTTKTVRKFLNQMVKEGKAKRESTTVSKGFGRKEILYRKVHSKRVTIQKTSQTDSADSLTKNQEAIDTTTNPLKNSLERALKILDDYDRLKEEYSELKDRNDELENELMIANDALDKANHKLSRIETASQQVVSGTQSLTSWLVEK